MDPKMKKFFEALNALGKPKRRDIIEKDYYIQGLLAKMSVDPWLKNNLIFRGGTCLIKAYLDYYRFSEDIDFIWKDQGFWDDVSRTQGRKKCASWTDNLVEKFKDIAAELDMRFDGDKKDPDQVQIHGGGRMVLFKIGFPSAILGIDSYVKIDISFQERLFFDVEMRKLNNYVGRYVSKDLSVLYEDLYNRYNEQVQMYCYDIKEIFLEKCRASITRRAFKLRDLIDISFIMDKYDYKIEVYKKEIIRKTVLAAKNYSWVREFLREEAEFDIKTEMEEEVNLLLIPVPQDLSRSLISISEELIQIRDIVNDML